MLSSLVRVQLQDNLDDCFSAPCGDNNVSLHVYGYSLSFYGGWGGVGRAFLVPQDMCLLCKCSLRASLLV